MVTQLRKLIQEQVVLMELLVEQVTILELLTLHMIST